MATRIENGIEMVPRKQVAQAFERVAANAWVDWTPEHSAAQDSLAKPPVPNPARRLTEANGQVTHWGSYLELVSTAAALVSLHVVSQRLMGNGGIFLAGGVIIVLPIIRETAPSVIREAIRFLKR